MTSLDIVRQFLSEMSAVEGVAALLILVNVWLITRRSIWNYAFGIVGVAIYGWVFFHAKLYSDMLLQVFFLVVQLYGLQQWRKSRAEAGEVVVERLRNGERLAWLAGIVAAVAAWGWLMHRLTDASFPWWDAGVAMTSVAAQILMSVRKLENWWLWMVANVLSIGLYAAKALWITTGLYVVLLGLAIWGLARWQAARHEARA
ncbi:nicotinamide riboside transporter PnuC [Sphingomonas sp.]|jgi:nicotinamide mononucleotide transporter|uniref:nicotinamide riboside transporter PnuC n=1 Tax=Sphingomonas sp. TaxID=28214 RepID=UPI002E370679|nr:nicotinamide riboside transporter PnuC [Sphingomonas sp.]HEX4693174.1 nicotinamide riboside transporter PnuC [Sphingomonas sp.]